MYGDSDSQSDSDGDDRDDMQETSTPVYPGAEITLGVSMLLIISFVTKHNLTGEGLSDLLQLINLHCLKECLLPRTLYKFKQWFADLKHPLVYHKYCARCCLLIDAKAASNVCANPLCNADLSKVESLDYFIEFPIEYQLQSLCKRQGFLDKLRHRFTRKKKNAGAYEDIYDGKVYKDLCSQGLLDKETNVSFTWNTDGIPVFKSSKMSMWPVYLMLNELPYASRQKSDNMILAGLWFGKGKPLMQSYFEPLHDALCKLETQGIEIKTETERCVLKGFLICGTFDLPARASVCNMNQYNGQYSCIKCEQRGETCKAGKGNVHIYPPQRDNIMGPKRTDASVKACGELAAKESSVKQVQGIKGPSHLSYFRCYSLVRGTGIDYMHGILLGVVKLLANLWFSSEHSDELFSLWKHVAVVDKQLEEIKPPNNIRRAPRSLSDHKQYWKASEWRNWLLYYSVPIIRDIALKDYFDHYLLLVQATFVMLQDSIIPSQLEMCEQMLTEFVVMFPALYGARYLTLNVHQLLHLPECVRDLGPLWAFSCFPFEDINGKLMKMFHGTQHVDKQIVSAVSTLQKIPELYHKDLLYHPDALAFYSKMCGEFVRKNDVLLEDDTYAVGSKTLATFDSLDSLAAVCDLLAYMPAKFVRFSRIRKGREVFHSKMYTRTHKRNSYTITYEDSSKCIKYGLVQYYLQCYPPCNHGVACKDVCRCAAQNIAVVSELRSCPIEFCVETQAVTLVERPDRGQPHIAIPLVWVKKKCVLVDLRGSMNMYICQMPNITEKD